MKRKASAQDVIQHDILECSPLETLGRVTRKMSEQGCKSILVVDEDQPIGIWTERDVLKVNFLGTDASNILISEVMRKPVETIPAKMPLDEVTVAFYKRRISCLLVVDQEGSRLGIITQANISANPKLNPSLLSIRLSQIVTPSPSISAENTLIEAVNRMRAYQTDAIVVMSLSNAIGILSQRELVRVLAGKRSDCLVGEIATPSMLTMQYDETIFNARNTMLKAGLSHLGVTDHSGQFIGLVSFSDVLKYIEEMYTEELAADSESLQGRIESAPVHSNLAENIIEFSKDAILITDKEGMIQSVNPSFSKMMGYAPEDVIGKAQSIFNSDRHERDFYDEMWSVLKSLGHWRGEVWSRGKNGNVMPHDLSISRIPDKKGDSYFFSAIYRDISMMKVSEAEVRKLAFHDPLTGLPNRRSIENRLERKLATTKRRGKIGALLYIDLDHFKPINDSLGHAVGDELLIKVASRLTESLREEDTPARYGGDEFLVLLSDLGSEMEEAVALAHTVAKKVEKAIRTPYFVNGHRFILGASVGISMFPEGHAHFKEIVKEGDTAMYRAKKSKNKIQFFRQSESTSINSLASLESSLQEALDKDQFLLHYQIQEDRQGDVVGMEAFLRWNHPKRGVVSPYKLIMPEEKSPIIISMGKWVLDKACRQIKSWSEREIPFRQLSVNIDEYLFLQDDFVTQVQDIVKETEIDPHLLVFEIGEGVIFNNFEETFQKMRALKSDGFRFAIDDFGSDCVSLSDLKLLPLEKIKVDYRYVRDLYGDPHNNVIVQTIIAIAYAMEFDVIAGGIETREQMEILQKMGCQSFQGHFISQSLPDSEVTELILSKTRDVSKKAE